MWFLIKFRRNNWKEKPITQSCVGYMCLDMCHESMVCAHNCSMDHPHWFFPNQVPMSPHFLSQFSQAYKWGHIKIWCKISFFWRLTSRIWCVAGSELRQASGLFVEGRCVGLWWLEHSKHARDIIGLSWFRTLMSPTSSSMMFFLLGMPNCGFTTEELRESLARKLHDAIVLGFLVSTSG